MRNEVKERVGFKNYLGVALMSLMDCLAASVMTSWFLLYLTDYSGIANAALVGSTMLLVMRLFDAVNDPIEGWIMDKAKVGKYGKYKPFIFLAILCEFVGVSCLFFIPEEIAAIPVLAIIWVVISYLVYDIGASFYAPNLIYRTLTLDSVQRGKLMIAPRILSMVLGMVVGSLVSIVGGVNEIFGNLHTSFGITILVMSAGCTLAAILGIALVKEKYHSKEDLDGEKKEMVKIGDIFKLFAENEALRIRFLSTIFSGFIWTFLFAAATYYVKWAYCADITTGAVNTELFGTYSLVVSMMMLLPLIIGTVIATPLMKVFKRPHKLYRIMVLIQAVCCGILFLLQILGVLELSFIPFIICLAVCSTSIGVNYIPGESVNIECMDYEIYKNGKDRSALVNATAKFLDKAQNAVSSGIVGVVLVAVGYEVDSVSGDYVGSLENIPSMLTGFMVIMGLIPFILGIISFFIYGKYPITQEIADEMKKGRNQEG